MRNKRKQLVRRCSRQAGVTLVEMMVVVTIAALMVGLTIPAANMLLNSFESESGAKSIISAAMASARAIAAKEQRYAGIRFQKRYDPNNPDPLNESQYIIFIVQDPNIMAYGFRAVEGIQPIKLPDSIGVMDLLYRSDLVTGSNPDVNFANFNVISDTTTFSIVFSPSGKLVIHDVRTRNRNGTPKYPTFADDSLDDIFNTLTRINDSVNPTGMFCQDDYFIAPTNFGLGPESSRNSFVIYDTKKLKQTDTNLRWTNYLSQLKRFYINPYTGTIIN
jgi:prepilin-type N-terminal cleavage/methylation domain-containing protein